MVGYGDQVRKRGRPMMHIRRLMPEGRLSGAVIHAGTVYLAGQVPDDTALDAEGQTADVLRQIDTILAQAGTDKQHLLSVQIVLRDGADYDGMNRAWDAWVVPAHAPARMTIVAGLARPGWRVEITGVAALPLVSPLPMSTTSFA